MSILCKNIRCCCPSFTFLLVFSAFLVTQNSRAQEWELKKERKGVKVYTRDTGASDLKEYKALMLVKTSIDKVLGIIIDGDNLWKWNYRTTASKIVKTLSEDEFVFWIKNDLPWPLKDRDHLSRIKVTREENGSIIIHISPETMYSIPGTEDTIRLHDFEGRWILVTQGEYVEITQEMRGDPGGSIPAWLINTVLISAPYNSFLNLKELLEK